MDSTPTVKHSRERIVRCLGLAILSCALAWMGAARAYAHIITPRSVSMERIGETAIIDVTDQTTCFAVITARSQDPTVATVSPTGPVEAISQIFTVTSQTGNPSVAFLTISFEGFGADAEGNPCTEKASATIDVTIGGGPESDVCAGVYSNGDIEFDIQRSGTNLSGTVNIASTNTEGTVVGGVNGEEVCYLGVFVVDDPHFCTLAIGGKFEEITEDDSTFGKFEFGGGKDCNGLFPPFSFDLPKTSGAGDGP